MKPDLTNKNQPDKVEPVVLSKAQKAFLEYCREIDWGKVEVIIKGGEPVFVTRGLRDTKFD